jgi:hypothetical protein
VGHNLAANRELTVPYIVYEVVSGTEVWNGAVPVTKSETKFQLQKFDGAVTYTLDYPKFPSVVDAFASASRGFAENLPKKKSSLSFPINSTCLLSMFELKQSVLPI